MTPGLQDPTLLANLARQVPGVIYQYRLFPDGRSCFPFASEAIREIYEVAPADVREDAALVFSRLHPDDLAAVSASIERSAATLEAWDQEYRVVLPQRGRRWLHGQARPERLADGSVLWHGYITDVTERHEQTEQLRRLETAIGTSITGIAIADMQGRLQYANQAALDVWGFDSHDDVRGRLVREFWDPAADAWAHWEAVKAAGTDTRVMTAARRDGTRRRIQVRTNLITNPAGPPLGILASFLDVTETEATAAELRLRSRAMDTTINALAIADAEGRIVYCNSAFSELWRYRSPDEVVGRHAFQFADPAVVARILESLAAEGEYRGELLAQRPDGTTFQALLSANAMRDADGRVQYLMGSIADVTESRRLQAQLAQSEKMQTIGRLAGGVAHDFNNLLTVMKGFLALARGSIPAGTEAAADLLEVDRAVDSAASLTQQLLAFSRRQTIVPQVLDLNALVQGLRAMLQRLIGEHVELVVDLDPAIGRVRFDPNQMEQVLINLAVNARDAMPAGGRLRIATREVAVDAGAAAQEPRLAAGPHVELTVSDSGLGMTEEVRSQLFEPFFTTKEPGHGTGLGLAMVYGAVTQNEGRITVESAPASGATFRILLPRVDVNVRRRTSPNDATLPQGFETVVVVEDEPAIRTLTTRVLEKQGYHVLSYATGPEALAVLRGTDETVDLLVTDVIMPEMHGAELARQARALRPGLRVLFVSGYTEDVIGHHGVLAEGVDFLAKPYSVSSLTRRVREALDRPAAG